MVSGKASSLGATRTMLTAVTAVDVMGISLIRELVLQGGHTHAARLAYCNLQEQESLDSSDDEGPSHHKATVAHGFSPLVI
jgi:hypothetical protein